jgi:hypothetical protein
MTILGKYSLWMIAGTGKTEANYEKASDECETRQK